MFQFVNALSMFAMDNDSWTLTGFLNSLNNSLNKWGMLLVSVIGIIMVIVAIVNIAKGLMSNGRGQTNWVLNIALLLIGGMLAWSSGWALIGNLSAGANDTLMQLGEGKEVNAIVIDVGAVA